MGWNLASMLLRGVCDSKVSARCLQSVCWMPLGLVTHMNSRSAVLYLLKGTDTCILNRFYM